MILKSNNPAKQKYFGRKVKNFKSEIWNNVCNEVIIIVILKLKII